MRRVTLPVCLVLLGSAFPCRAQDSAARPGIVSTSSARRVQVGRMVFELPSGFVADATANMMDQFHPPMHQWRRGRVVFIAHGCTSGHGPDACFFSFEKRGKQIAQWKLDSAWTAMIESRGTAKRRVLVAHYAPADSSWAVKATFDVPTSADEAELVKVLLGARLAPIAARR